MEDQKIPFEEQKELAYKFLDILADKFVGFPNYKPLKEPGTAYTRDYLGSISQALHSSPKKSHKNVATAKAQFLIETTLFGFEHFKNFMLSVENLFKDFKDLHFNLEADIENEQVFVHISIDKFYERLTDESDNTFRSLLGLNKFNL